MTFERLAKAYELQDLLMNFVDAATPGDERLKLDLPGIVENLAAGCPISKNPLAYADASRLKFQGHWEGDKPFASIEVNHNRVHSDEDWARFKNSDLRRRHEAAIDAVRQHLLRSKVEFREEKIE